MDTIQNALRNLAWTVTACLCLLTATSTIAANPIPGTAYHLLNPWQNIYLADGGTNSSYAAPTSNTLYQWIFEATSDGAYEIRNKATGDYLNVENYNGLVQVTPRIVGWASSRWTIEPNTDGTVKIRSRWHTSDYIHVEHTLGGAEIGSIYEGWASARWELVPAISSTSSAASSVSTPSTIQIQAENYSSMSGVQAQPTSDTGGGQNLGWIDAGDWFSYNNINIPSAGTYTIAYRVASLSGSGSLQFEQAGGTTIYGKLAVSSTGGWQNWTTIYQTVTLKAGVQNFGIKVLAGGWNINWFSITPLTTPTSQSSSSQKFVSSASSSSKSSAVSASSLSSSKSSALPTSSSSSAATRVLQLPLEVLSDGSSLAPKIVEAGLTVDSGSITAVNQLWFSCHRCGFFGAPEYEATTQAPIKIKASLRVLGGVNDTEALKVPWIDITEANVSLAEPERLQGGLNWGGFYTQRMTLFFDAATRARLVGAPAINRIQFRFNGTDGESNGYRILNIQLQNAQAINLTANTIQYADIKIEKDAGKVWSPDVTAGDTLWHATNRLQKSFIVPRTINAGCSSCHASDGRDLQYFNYSNNAIVQRSKFHGLSDIEAKQVVAYLRYNQRNLPHVAQAAPWNPPYQPGPNMDKKTIVEWSAGAGLAAVLDSPLLSMKALLGKPLDNTPLAVSQAEMDALMNPDGTMNTREMAIPLQLPDWNAWLPTVHPMDVWPISPNDASGSFINGATFGNGNQNPNASALRIENWLSSHLNPNGIYADWSHLTPAQRNEIQNYFRNFGWEAYHFIGGGRGNHISDNRNNGSEVGATHLATLVASQTTASDPGAFTTNAFIERAVCSMMQWNAVRQWEWAQKYGLENNQRDFLGAYDSAGNTWKGRGEIRGWPFNTVSVFNLAPHMLYQQDTDNTGKITREWVMAWERNNILGSYYRTNAWYQLQMVINPGAQDIFSNYPMDWPYHWSFAHLLSKTIGTNSEPNARQALNHRIRNIAIHAKMGQYVNNDFPLNQPDPAAPTDIWKNKGLLGRAIALKHLMPSHDFLLDISAEAVDQSPYRAVETLLPGLYLKTVNASIAQFNSLYGKTLPNQWRRCDPNYISFGFSEPYAPFRFCLDAQRSPVPQDSQGRYKMNGGGLNTTDQMLQYSVWKAEQLGAEPVRLKNYADWVNFMFPQ